MIDDMSSRLLRGSKGQGVVRDVRDRGSTSPRVP